MPNRRRSSWPTRSAKWSRSSTPTARGSNPSLASTTESRQQRRFLPAPGVGAFQIIGRRKRGCVPPAPQGFNQKHAGRHPAAGDPDDGPFVGERRRLGNDDVEGTGRSRLVLVGG